MFLVLAISMVNLSSCKKDNDGGDGKDGSSGIIKAKVNGSAFSSMEMTSFATKATGGGQTTLIIQGNTSTQAISIHITGYDGVGTYEIKDSNVFTIATYMEPDISNPTNSPTWNAPYQSSGTVGQIKIAEETSTHIIGSFNFKAKNMKDNSIKDITGGSFNLKIQ